MTAEMKPSFGLNTLYYYLIFVSCIRSNWCIHFLPAIWNILFIVAVIIHVKYLYSVCSNVSQVVVQRSLASGLFRVVVKSTSLCQNLLIESVEWDPGIFIFKQASQMIFMHTKLWEPLKLRMCTYFTFLYVLSVSFPFSKNWFTNHRWFIKSSLRLLERILR